MPDLSSNRNIARFGANGRRIFGSVLTLLGRISAIGGSAVTALLLPVMHHPLAVAAADALVGAVIMSILLTLKRRKSIGFLCRKVTALAIAAAKSSATASIVALALTNAGAKIGLVFAVASLPLGMVNALYYTAPLIVSAIDGWKAGRSKVHAILWPMVAAVGIGMLTSFWTGHINLLGFVFALGAGACRAISLPISRSHIRRGVAGLYSTIAVAGSAAVITLLSFAIGDDLTPAWGTASIGLVILCGLLATTVPQVVQIVGRRFLNDFHFGMLLALAPVLAAGIGWAFLKQTLDPVVVGGIVVITCAIAGAWRTSR